MLNEEESGNGSTKPPRQLRINRGQNVKYSHSMYEVDFAFRKSARKGKKLIEQKAAEEKKKEMIKEKLDKNKGNTHLSLMISSQQNVKKKKEKKFKSHPPQSSPTMGTYVENYEAHFIEPEKLVEVTFEWLTENNETEEEKGTQEKDPSPALISAKKKKRKRKEKDEKRKKRISEEEVINFLESQFTVPPLILPIDGDDVEDFKQENGIEEGNRMDSAPIFSSEVLTEVNENMPEIPEFRLRELLGLEVNGMEDEIQQITNCSSTESQILMKGNVKERKRRRVQSESPSAINTGPDILLSEPNVEFQIIGEEELIYDDGYMWESHPPPSPLIKKIGISSILRRQLEVSLPDSDPTLPVKKKSRVHFSPNPHHVRYYHSPSLAAKKGMVRKVGIKRKRVNTNVQKMTPQNRWIAINATLENLNMMFTESTPFSPVLTENVLEGGEGDSKQTNNPFALHQSVTHLSTASFDHMIRDWSDEELEEKTLTLLAAMSSEFRELFLAKYVTVIFV